MRIPDFVLGSFISLILMSGLEEDIGGSLSASADDPTLGRIT